MSFFKNQHQLQWRSFLSGIILIVALIVIGLIIFRHNGVWLKIKQWPWMLRLRIYLGKKGWQQHVIHEWVRFKEGWLLLLHEHPVSIFWAIAGAVMYWAFYLLLAPIIFWAMGKTISFFELIGWQLLFNFAQVFIPTPGGSGGSELILVYLFKNLIGATRVGTFVLLWKIYTFFSTLVIGGFFFWKLTKKVNR